MKISGAAVGGLALGGLGFNMAPVKAHAQLLKISWAKETTTICPYCAVGCGVIVHTARDGRGKVSQHRGRPDHPINRGAPVPQGRRLCTSWPSTTSIGCEPIYRAPDSDKWEEKSWDWALD